MNFKKFQQFITAALFFGIIILFAGAAIVLPKSYFSEEENRALSEFPTVSARAWFSGELSSDLGEYLCEHFPLRNGWIGLRTSLERLAGHDEINGVYFSGGSFYETPIEPDYEVVDRSINAINSFGEKLGGRLSVMLAPTSSQIYSDRLPDFAPKPDEKKLINYVYSKLSPSVQAVDVYDALYRSREDYIYYRTDHHWTTRGAYVAYKALMGAYGYEPVSEDKINVEHASHGFLGTLYSKVLSEYAEPDTVDFYTSAGPEVTDVEITGSDGNVTKKDSVYFRENLEIKDKYLSFLGANVPKIEITSEYSGGSILVIKDSYANCFVPFLTKHFERVTVVDMRYIMDLGDYVDPGEYDRVLILYNASTFAEDRNVAKLGAGE